VKNEVVLFGRLDNVIDFEPNVHAIILLLLRSLPWAKWRTVFTFL